MIVIATDAWEPQINGVVSTLKKIREECPSIHFITPNYFKTFKCPGYKDISLALVRSKSIENFMIQNQPKHIHIATEGPIGLAVRNWCIRNNKNFTTSYHTKFPEFLWAMYKIPTFITYSYMKWFHSKSSAVMVTTESLKKDLEERGFKNIVRWTRGVDLKEFFPVYYYKTKTDYPSYLYVGRVSKEKNIEAFLNLDLHGNKIVVGDGPELEKLKQKYPTVNFLGALSGADLAFVYQSASCFVFPSKTDTFGLVIIEALACGTPVAAYPVTGPIDILNDKVGAMDWDLKVACEKAVKLNPKDCYKFAKKHYNWKTTAKIFISNLKV